MVDHQVACEQRRKGPSRYLSRRLKAQHAFRPLPLADEQLAHLVLGYAEANAPALVDPVQFEPELLHLVALRPSTRERFEAVIAPRQPLAEGTPAHLELSAGGLLAGEDLDLALARWRTFLGPSAILAAWGTFTRQLLAAAGAPAGLLVDLREAAARALQARPGGIESTAEKLGIRPVAVWAAGRAGRRLAALEQVLEGLLHGNLPARRAGPAPMTAAAAEPLSPLPGRTELQEVNAHGPERR